MRHTLTLGLLALAAAQALAQEARQNPNGQQPPTAVPT